MKSSHCLRYLALCVLITLVPGSLCFADFYHYNDPNIGTRAVGFGGAYTAISDDSAGVVYNPAGLAFAKANKISVSTNSFQQNKIRAEGAYAGRDIGVETSGQNSFLGGVFHDFLVENSVVGIALYIPQNENEAEGFNFGADPNFAIKSMHLQRKADRTQTHLKGAFATKLNKNTAVGLSLGYARYALSGQYFSKSVSNLASSSDIVTNEDYNLNADFLMQAIEIGGGVRLAIADDFDLGISLLAGYPVAQSLQIGFQRNSIVTHDDGTPLTDAEAEAQHVDNRKYATDTIKGSTSHSWGTYPITARIGSAWRPVSSSTLSLDVSYVSTHLHQEESLAFGPWQAVVNVAFGGEYVINRHWTSQLGFFSNRDANPKVHAGNVTAFPHIDYYGSSWALSWKQDEAEYSLGTVYQYGRGQWNPIRGGDVNPIRPAVGESLAIMLALSNAR